MKIFICVISVFCLSVVNAQKPPIKAANCNTVVAISYDDLTDEEGISLRYSKNNCVHYYKGKPYTGKVKWCKKDKIKEVVNYVNGKLEGETYSYYLNGNLFEYTGFGVDNFEVLNYDPTTTVFSYSSSCWTIGGDDPNRFYNGKYLKYHENGVLWYKGLYVNGSRDGTWYFYDEQGAVFAVINYKEGLNNGEYIVYYGKKGIVKYKGNFLNGNLDGTWYAYDEEGAVMAIVKYIDGEQVSCSGFCPWEDGWFTEW
jgi:antitoxin component YwqK of YwqJK toxin-antitoxin module